MRALVVAIGLALSSLACADFDLDSRRFRCDGVTPVCDPGWACGPDGYCAPLPPIDADVLGEVCGNGLDDDGDLRIDCADSECPGQPTCGAGCICDDSGPIELACMDGLDNDGDGLRDCLDPSCPGACMGTNLCCPDGTCQQSCN